MNNPFLQRCVSVGNRYNRSAKLYKKTGINSIQSGVEVPIFDDIGLSFRYKYIEYGVKANFSFMSSLTDQSEDSVIETNSQLDFRVGDKVMLDGDRLAVINEIKDSIADNIRAELRPMTVKVIKLG